MKQLLLTIKFLIMATRCTIKVEGVKFAKVYKHWDGAPSSTLDWLESFNREFTEKRGVDPNYKFAQLLRSSKANEVRFNLDASNETGWGVYEYDTELDEDYEYKLHHDGSVTVKKI